MTPIALAVAPVAFPVVGSDGLTLVVVGLIGLAAGLWLRKRGRRTG